MEIEKFSIFDFYDEMYPNLYMYQKMILRKMIGKNKIIYTKIKGDAWDCILKPRNICGQASITLTDYDEENKKEAEIVIQFTKDELHDFIKSLKDIEDSM